VTIFIAIDPIPNYPSPYTVRFCYHPKSNTVRAGVDDKWFAKAELKCAVRWEGHDVEVVAGRSMQIVIPKVKKIWLLPTHHPISGIWMLQGNNRHTQAPVPSMPMSVSSVFNVGV
jgi:hypothetical protein